MTVFAISVIATVAVSGRPILLHSGAGTSEMTSSKEQIVVQSPTKQCSSSKEDCSKTKCCMISGYSCFEKHPGTYGCMDGCNKTHGYTCKMPHGVVPLVEVKDHANTDVTLYCMSVYTEDTGSQKENFELQLLQLQYQRRASIFDCDYHNVFSDVVVEVGSGYPTIKVEDAVHEFHLVKRKNQGTWINTGLFKQVWKAMKGQIGLEKADWVVKVDADAVFVPHRLKTALMGHPLTYTGIYFENCKEVQFGLFGNLEVWSIQAFNTLLANIDSCSTSIDWVKGTKWGPIGEDLFAQMCMDLHGVSKVQNFDLTTDAACPGTRKRWGVKTKTTDDKKWKPNCAKVQTPALHPFKKPNEYFSCLDATLSFAP